LRPKVARSERTACTSASTSKSRAAARRPTKECDIANRIRAGQHAEITAIAQVREADWVR